MMRVLKTTVCMVLVFLAYSSSSWANPIAKRVKWGNYCGSGNGDLRSGKKPIDKIDASCKRHDECCRPSTKVAGVSVCPCWCDKRLVDDVSRLSQSGMSVKQRTTIAIIKSVFSTHICHCKGRMCNYKFKCGTTKKCKTIRKKKLCVPVPYCKINKVCGNHAIRGWGAKCRLPRCATKKKCKRFMGKNFCFPVLVCKK
ncbi:MAG: hypothetical protein H6728_04530 [Myxococcales bacterium]|nr:hypothetical protein [Myxococcales bacterium]MCB9642319.1 hypothetical protein [Myxococcales bacterium]